MKIGHFVLNGEIYIVAPKSGGGVSLVGGQGTRKVLIGKLDDGSYVQETVGGNLYGSIIRNEGRADVNCIPAQHWLQAAGGQLETAKQPSVDNIKTMINK